MCRTVRKPTNKQDHFTGIHRGKAKNTDIGVMFCHQTQARCCKLVCSLHKHYYYLCVGGNDGDLVWLSCHSVIVPFSTLDGELPLFLYLPDMITALSLLIWSTYWSFITSGFVRQKSIRLFFSESLRILKGTVCWLCPRNQSKGFLCGKMFHVDLITAAIHASCNYSCRTGSGKNVRFYFIFN